ncbi:YT521-B-like domain-containing protein [Limtongia smithiae]|uniref:YT521-B-like domain-containing protein n=1 Tax=Limtongia smithiae TaxID=1125753 RepID=UPI0034CE9257
MSSLLPRGPPRKPKQSRHALWVGNLPAVTTVLDLRDMFASPTIISVFLISKSNCAFVNYSTEAAVKEALEKFKRSGGMMNGTKLVARLQRTSLGDRTNSPSLGPTDDGFPEANVEAAKPPELTHRQHQPESYFVLKSLTVDDLELSVQTQTWATQEHNEAVLNEAYNTSDNVYLIFSANKSGEYFGYARMAGPIVGDDSSAFVSALSSMSIDQDFPKLTFTPATASAPAGKIVDDSSRGTIFWEASTEESGPAPSSPTGTEALLKSWGTPFKLQWLSTNRVQFFRTKGLKNSWNSNRDVKIARDGTELEPSVGRKMIQLFNSSMASTTATPYPAIVPPPTIPLLTTAEPSSVQDEEVISRSPVIVGSSSKITQG